MSKKHKKPLQTFLQKQLDNLVIGIMESYASNNGSRLSYKPRTAIIKPSPLLPFHGEAPYFIRHVIGEQPFWRRQIIQPQVDAHRKLFALYGLSLSAEGQASLAAIFDEDVALNVKDTLEYLDRQGARDAQIYAVISSEKEYKRLPDHPKENIARLVWQLIEEERGALDPSSPLVFVTPLLAQYTLTQTLPEGQSTAQGINSFLGLFGTIPQNFVYNLLLDPERRRDLEAHFRANEEISKGFKALQDLLTPQPYPALLIYCTEFSIFMHEPTERNFFASLREYAGTDVTREIQQQNYRALYQAFHAAVMESKVHN